MIEMNPSPTIQRLLLAVIQIQDVDPAINALNQAGIYVTLMATTGAFLGQHNAALLIGLQEDREQQAVDILSHSCRRRVEYMATRLEGAPYHLPLTTPITVGGATIFTFNVERWEEIQ